MNITSRLHRKPGSFFGRLLTTGFSVWLLGVAFSPALAATTTPSPAVDQAPLIIQKPLPPNITLMLDDSGSMSWNFMPDWSYLQNNGDNNAVINASNNGVYYNPTVVYSSPAKADGTYYPSYTDMTAVPYNGFASTLTNVNLLTYDGSDDFDVNLNSGSKIIYNTSVEAAAAPTRTYDKVVKSQGSYWNPTYADQVCQNLYNSHSTASNLVFTGDDKDRNGGWLDGECKFSYNAYAFFQYSTGVAAGPYTVHYVAQNASDCAFAAVPANCVGVSDTSGTAAPAKDASKNALTVGQNIANWFAYYHTRILMAKSGLMNAFSGIDATYRIGFGSIDGGTQETCQDRSGNSYLCGGNQNYQNLPTNRYNYTDSYNAGGTNYIAQVRPFGVGTDTSSQKSVFWSWVSAAKAAGGTPLRQALDAVGQYYETDQPWQSTNATTGDTEQLTCRQSYTILTTDGFWNDSFTGPGNADAAGTVISMTGPDGRTYSQTLAAPYSDGNSDTLADVAMKYWATDLMSGSGGTTNLANEVPTSDDDKAFWQHMTTFTLGMGFPPQGITPSDASNDKIFAWATGGTAIPGFSWPKPAANDINNIADLEHAAVNGHGGFYSATSPTEFTDGIKKALERVSSRTGTGSSLAANSTQLKTGAFAYQANYYTGSWVGDLKAIKVNPNNGTLDTAITWSAADPKIMPTYDKRNIWTYNPAGTSASSKYVAFKNTSSTDTSTGTTTTTPAALSPAELTALGSDAAEQVNIIDYLRGDAALEKPKTGGIYRTRTTPLGDIVDSQPVFVGQPDLNQFNGEVFTGSDTFGTYAATARQNLIFVAANDGMLHAFYTDDIAATTTTAKIAAGTEAYAYLPAAVITSGVKDLANPDYGTSTVKHQFFNDGELTAGDVYFGSAWHTVVVGTTGRGLAKAVYALDVTDPANIKFLWERSAADGNADGNSKYIGQMTGKPVIAQTIPGTWSVLIGNGYNSTAGVAALLQFNIADGSLSAYPTTDSTTGNGLAAPAVWMDDLSTGISTMAYAGDLKGQVWSFALNKITVTKGTGQNPDVTTYTATPDGTAGTKLFTATDGATSPTAQPITSGMLIGKNPITHDLWLFFGTGQYLNSADLATRTTQSWYGLIVKAGATSGSTAVSSSTARTALMQRSIIAETPGTPEELNTDGTVKTVAVAPARAVTALPATSDIGGKNGKSGWYIDLLAPSSTTAPDPKDSTKTITTYTPNAIAQGERIVTPNQFQGNQLLATTRIPQAADLCNPSGRGWIMAVDPFTGTNPTSSFFDLNGDGLINQPADYIMVNGKAVATSGIGFSSLPNNPIFMGGSMLVSFDNGNATSIKTSGTSNTLQRVSWRELIAQ